MTYHPPILHDSVHPPSQVPIVSLGKGTDFAGLSMCDKILGQSRPLIDFDARCPSFYALENTLKAKS